MMTQPRLALSSLDQVPTQESRTKGCHLSRLLQSSFVAWQWSCQHRDCEAWRRHQVAETERRPVTSSHPIRNLKTTNQLLPTSCMITIGNCQIISIIWLFFFRKHGCTRLQQEPR